MRMIAITIAIGMLFSATAAATGGATIIRTSKPGGTYQEFAQDRRYCVRAGWHNWFQGQGSYFNRDMALHCMSKMGYVRDPRGFVLKLPG